ncbi:MAG: DUF2293 domain-containing protein [Gemmatimonadaceae bacterium]
MATPKPNAEKSGIVVFQLVRDSACSECGEKLGSGRWLRLEEGRPLCMTCADLAHLVFVPAGDAALTRRASMYSTLRAVVVRFSRARKRYERQGIFVEEPALARAERECLADADSRARARERRAERDAVMDLAYREQFAEHIRRLYPACPADETVAIAERACLKYSGRIGRSAAAKQFAPEAIELAVQAHVRHQHTAYDHLLARGIDRREARSAVVLETNRIIQRWRALAPK